MAHVRKESGKPTKLGAWRILGLLLLAIAGVWLSVAVYVEKRATPSLVQGLLAPLAPLAGRNAFAALWLLEQGVPPDQLEVVAAADLADHAHWRRNQTGTWQQPSEVKFSKAALPMEAEPAWCGRDTVSCLHTVQAEPAAYARLVQAHAPVWQRVQALSAYDGYQYPGERRVDAPLPRYSPLLHMLTVFATRFANGHARERAAAVQGLCQHLVTVRRLSEHDGTDLIFQSVGLAAVHRGTRLLADMRLQAPELPLPAECATALAPRADWPLATCQAMRGEALATANIMQETLGNRVFAKSVGGVAEMVGQTVRWAAMGSADLAKVEYARAIGRQCEAAHLAAIHEGRRPADEPYPWQASLAYAMRAPGGMLLLNLAASDMNPYARRLADREALRMAGRSWLWLQAQMQRQPVAQALRQRDWAQLDQVLQQRPAALQMAGRPVAVTQDGGGQPVLRLMLWQRIGVAEQLAFDLPLSR